MSHKRQRQGNRAADEDVHRARHWRLVRQLGDQSARIDHRMYLAKAFTNATFWTAVECSGEVSALM
jgi:hypothetical protein